MSRSSSPSRTPDNGTANPGTSSTRGNSFNRPKVNPPPYLVIDNDSAENWKMWRQMWNNYTIITGLNSQSEQFKTALLLYSLGPDAIRIYNGLKFEEDEDRNNSGTIIDDRSLKLISLVRQENFLNVSSSTREIKSPVSQLNLT